MELPELDALIEREAVDEIPPFGARSVSLARELGPRARGLLVEKVRSGGCSAFLALEALRESDAEAFDRLSAEGRAQIYVDALRRNAFFNAWGVPGYNLTATSRALIALGEAAVSTLAPLLPDKSKAPLEGSRDATTSAIYQNRICDYAWLFLSEIRGLAYTYSRNPADRDRHIGSLLASLKPKVGEQL